MKKQDREGFFTHSINEETRWGQTSWTVCLVPVSLLSGFHLGCPQPLGTGELPRPSLCGPAFRASVPRRFCVCLLKTAQKATAAPARLPEVQPTWSVGQEQMVLASWPDGLLSPPVMPGCQKQLQVGESARAGEGPGFF